MQKFFCYLLLIVSNLLCVSSVLASEEKTPSQAINTQAIHAQAKDLKYGTALYELYQGHAFEALSALNVAKLRGGITGHHDHPTLIEGSLMLTYGMTHEAKVLFESLLLKKKDVGNEFVSESARNQAWFYLGKVLMLEQDLTASMEALKHVNSNNLKEDQPEIFYEWLYLKAFISQKLSSSENKPAAQKIAAPIKIKEPLTLVQLQKAETKSRLEGKPESFYSWLYENGEINQETTEALTQTGGYVWQAYLRYNLAIEALNDERYDIANQYFELLVSDLSLSLVNDENNSAELLALKDQSLLSLGQLHLYQNNYEQALTVLKRIKIESVFSDQALFAYAVAASNIEEFGLALQALNTLKGRELFTPWLQQTPYALAYLYEQLGEPELALEAYSAAVGHYENLTLKLEQEQAEVTETKLLQALSLQEASIEQDLLSGQEIPLALGRDRVANDEYGYLQVDPSDFNYAELLAMESFQLGLRDLHDLYKLKFSLNRWEDQLGSFDSMMASRVQLRDERIKETLSVMASQKSEQWIKQQQIFSSEFDREVKTENSAFFMDDTQREYQSIIQRMTKNLELLPNGEEKESFARKLEHVDAYFSWWIDNQYSVNRWASQKQLNGLTRAVDQFKKSNETLKKHISSDGTNQRLFERINDGRTRLSILKLELGKNLDQASANLLVLVKEELGRQREETQNYLLAASKAQARLADALFINRTDDTEAQTQGELESQESDK